jgi:autotransporter passenger strand-loop-strand repeat protein
MASTLTSFTSGDLVISIVGNGDGSGNYTDNQATPITLEELTTSGTVVGQLVLPQQTTVVNGVTEYATSGEYGSSSEGTIQLAANGQSIVIGGYGVNAATYNAGGATVYGNAALAQSTSLTGTNYTPVARVVADISYNATIDTSTALYNVYNTNNPRSVSTVDGTRFYLSGQGVKGDTTQGVFTATDGSSSATAIDTSTDTRTAEIVNGVLYVSRDSTQGASGTSNIASYGTTLPTSATAFTPLAGIMGKVTLTAAQANGVNNAAIGSSVNLSPENFFFANATTLYVADGGNPKEGGLGDGGLQKWSLVGGTWVLDYTLTSGLSLVADTNSSGSTGLIGLTGVVNGGTVTLYATNSTLGDLDQTYLYTITDTLSATTLPTSESFSVLVSAAADTNIRGISFAPSASATTPTNVTVTSGVTSSGLTVTSGSTLTVSSGGILTSATILSSGTATVSGTDTGTIIGQGGTETLLGSATGDVVEGTQIVSAATAVVSGEVVNNGGALDLYLKGAVASNTTVFTGGSLNISGNATAVGTVISGGLVSLQSPKAVLSGSVTFAGSGTIQVTSASSAGFGDLAVISGFGSGDVIDNTTLAYSGASLSTAVVSGNTVATVTNGAVSAAYTFAGSVASSLKLAADSLATPGAEIAFLAPTPVSTVVASGVTSTGNSITSGSTLTVSSGGTLVSGTIQSGVALGSAIIIGNDSGTTILAGGNEVVSGTATGDQISGVQLVSAATAIASNETVFNGGALDLFLKGGVATGTVVSSGGTLAISGNAVASNTTLAGGATLALQSPKANLSGSVIMQGTNNTILVTGATSAGFGDFAVISGFVTGDTVDLATFGTGAVVTSAVSSGNTVVTVSSGTGSQSSEAFIFAGAYTSGFFALAPDGNGGQQITANGTPCYCPGTLIQTETGEVPVEQLAIGDHVTTASGQQRPIKWIGRRAYGGRFAAGKKHILPIRFAAGSLGEGLPKRDLMVSPLHAMFIDDVLIPASALVNGVSIVQLDRVDNVEYIHIELDTHDVILAEGAPSETFVDDQSRGMFHNAGEYDCLYPDTAIEPARYCAPRLEDGEEVEAVRRRLAALAAPAASFGAGLDGCLDEVSRGRVRGWARDLATPGQPVQLQIVADGLVLCEVPADTFRADLLAAGIGNGRHAFDVAIPGGLSPDETHVISVRRKDDGAALPLRRVA